MEHKRCKCIKSYLTYVEVGKFYYYIETWTKGSDPKYLSEDFKSRHILAPDNLYKGYSIYTDPKDVNIPIKYLLNNFHPNSFNELFIDVSVNRENLINDIFLSFE